MWYFNPWTAGHWLGGRAGLGHASSPTSPTHPLPEALSPPRLAVTLPTLSHLPVCLSSAASPTSLSPPHHLFSPSLCVPPHTAQWHSPVAAVRWWHVASVKESAQGTDLLGSSGRTRAGVYDAHTHTRAHNQDPSLEQRDPLSSLPGLPQKP